MRGNVYVIGVLRYSVRPESGAPFVFENDAIQVIHFLFLKDNFSFLYIVDKERKLLSAEIVSIRGENEMTHQFFLSSIELNL